MAKKTSSNLENMAEFTAITTFGSPLSLDVANQILGYTFGSDGYCAFKAKYPSGKFEGGTSSPHEGSAPDFMSATHEFNLEADVSGMTLAEIKQAGADFAQLVQDAALELGHDVLACYGEARLWTTYNYEKPGFARAA